MSQHRMPGASSRPHRRCRLVGVSTLAALLVSLTAAGLPSAAGALPRTQYGLWSSKVTPSAVSARGHRRVRLGTEFTASETGTVVALQFYRTSGTTGTRYGSLWTSSGRRLARVTFAARNRDGWQTAWLSRPVAVHPGVRYVAAYVSPRGRYALARWALSPTDVRRRGPLEARRGVYTYGAGVPRRSLHASHYYVDVIFRPRPAPASTPTPSTSPSGFPDASNTGVPDGVTLTRYAGPYTVTTPGTVIDGKLIGDDLLVEADDVTVRNSRINGRLVSDWGGSVTVTDSEIDGGDQEEFPTVSYSNITLRRVEVTGGQHSVQCDHDCTVIDSWLHDQYLPSDSAGHVNAFISNGGSHFLLRHNTLHCTVPLTPNDGGCTADLSLFGDFDPISDVTVDDNLFKANMQSISFCTHAGYNPGKPYGSNPTGVHFTNNVFERGSNRKCGVYGPVTSFLEANGNTWSGNVWEDGGAVSAD